jgi:hypothetical protein
MFAVCIFSVGILAIYTMQLKSIDGNANAFAVNENSNWASNRIEQLLTLPYRDPLLEDTDGDGTGQDDGDGTGENIILNGIDDDDNGDSVIDADERFGLYHDTDSTADHHETSPDGLSTIYWNVAVDVPIPNTKTIRVIVIPKQQRTDRHVAFEYEKTDII